MKTALLSYPRSGNTWTRYCLEWMTKRPSLSLLRSTTDLRERPLGETLNLGVDLTAKPCVVKRHDLHVGKSEFDRLILLLRDPLYCIPRHRGSTPFKASRVRAYVQMLVAYEEFAGPKMVVHYDDMIASSFSPFVAEMLDLLEEPIDAGRFRDLIEREHVHRSRCQMLYEWVRRQEFTPIVHLEDREAWLGYFRSLPQSSLLDRYLNPSSLNARAGIY